MTLHWVPAKVEPGASFLPDGHAFFFFFFFAGAQHSRDANAEQCHSNE